MKEVKTYKYKYKYIKYINVINKEFKVNNDDIVDISITKDNEVTVKKDDKLIKYRDNGATSIYLKALGKVVLISEIALAMDIGCDFKITDDRGNDYGISKILTLNNNYLIIGGFNNWSIIIDIGDKTDKDFIITKILDYIDAYGFCDFKTMYILISKDIAKNIDSNYFLKPYLYIID